MSISIVFLELMDNGGRRLSIDTRQFLPTGQILDRRIIADRRTGFDRRNDSDRRSGEIVHKKIQRPENDLREGIDRRSNPDRRVAFSEISKIYSIA